MPNLRKIAAPTVKAKGKRGRPKGSTTKEKVYIFGATCGKGCANGESGIKSAMFECKHGYPFKYLKAVMK